MLEKYDEIMNIILPTLGTERKKTYCPFLPICPDTGKVLEIPMSEMDKKKGTLIFDNDGKKLETKITSMCYQKRSGSKILKQFSFLAIEWVFGIICFWQS